jgi:hypothetical protein
MALDGERRESLQLLDHHPPGNGHVAGITPGNLQHRPAHEVLTVEEGEVEIVELEGYLVSLPLGILEGEADKATAQVERRAGPYLLVGEKSDADAGGTAIDGRVH